MFEDIDVLEEMKAFARLEVVWQNGDVESEFVATLKDLEVAMLVIDSDTVMLMLEAPEGVMVNMVPNDKASYNTKARDMAGQVHLRRLMLAGMQNRIISPANVPRQQQFQPGGVVPFPGLKR